MIRTWMKSKFLPLPLLGWSSISNDFFFFSFDPLVKKRNNDVSREKQEMAKLNHKLKREKKAAKKDLRADAAFLAKQKAKEKREKDDERTRKTKAILGGLGGQEGEYRQMQRQKKKKKF